MRDGILSDIICVLHAGMFMAFLGTIIGVVYTVELDFAGQVTAVILGVLAALMAIMWFAFWTSREVNH